MKKEEGIIERHNVMDQESEAGHAGARPVKTRLQKDVQRQIALAFKEGAEYVVNNNGVAKGRSYENACTECAEKRTREVELIFKKHG